MKDAAFFQDLAVLMAAAGFAAVLFTRLKWPKVIGYLLAGVLMGEHTWGGSFLRDPRSIATIGQLGVVFLMFSLGLEFSGSQMKRVKHVSVPTALVDMTVMIWLGYTAGREFLGWGAVPSLFLGAALSDSATTLLAKTIDEMRWSSRPFVKYVFGTTICEDVLCVATIALVTGVAHGKGMNFADAARSLGGLAVFFVFVLVMGLAWVPRALNAVGRLRDGETLLLALLGCCFLVSFVAARLDYSLALGAFLVGVLGASSDVRVRLHDLVAPLRDMFAAVFFVAIGLMVDPAACWHNAPAIFALAAVVVVGKAFNCFALSLLTGESVKDAVQTGLGLAQIGEFAYMVALLYVAETGDAANPIYPVVVGVSLVTTCLNAPLLRFSDPFGAWLENHVPARAVGWLAAYRDWLARFRAAGVPSRLQRRIRAWLAWMAIIAVVNGVVLFAASRFAAFDWSRFVDWSPAVKKSLACVAADLFCFASFVPLGRLATHLGHAVAVVIAGGAARRRGGWRAAVVEVTTLFVRALVLGGAAAEIAMFNVNLAPDGFVARLVLAAVLLVALLFGWKHIKRSSLEAGRHFNAALAAERRQGAKAAVTLSVPGDFYGEVPVLADSPAVGATIRALDVRAKTGVNVVAVVREGKRQRNPGPDWTFAAGDVAVVLGDAAQLARFRALVKER